MNKICLNNFVTQFGNLLHAPKTELYPVNNHSFSLANITLRYILQPIAGVLKWGEIFRRFIDCINRITASETANGSNRQAPTSAFSHSGLALFRQACTVEQAGEVEFLDVDHSMTTEDDFGFVTKDLVQPTAEGSHGSLTVNHITQTRHWSQSYSVM